LKTPASALSEPVCIGLIGAGRIGTAHAATLVRHVPGACLIAGGIGTPQLIRSTTRDPGLADPGRVPPWTIFTQTLIHDFDTINWLNPRAEPVEVYAAADALVAPDFKDAGLLDTAVVVLKFDNGAFATAEV
jgi:myo-inositol 2-dehydrogenase/D-chiro-inositol 1-dehydrogenase